MLRTVSGTWQVCVEGYLQGLAGHANELEVRHLGDWYAVNWEGENGVEVGGRFAVFSMLSPTSPCSFRAESVSASTHVQGGSSRSKRVLVLGMREIVLVVGRSERQYPRWIWEVNDRLINKQKGKDTPGRGDTHNIQKIFSDDAVKTADVRLRLKERRSWMLKGFDGARKAALSLGHGSCWRHLLKFFHWNITLTTCKDKLM